MNGRPHLPDQRCRARPEQGAGNVLKLHAIAKYHLLVTAVLWLALSSCSAGPTAIPGLASEIPLQTATSTEKAPTATEPAPGVTMQASPTVSQTPLPTWTPHPTLTPLPTLGPTATSFPPVVPASESDQPAALFDLIYLQRGVLRTWDSESGQILDLMAGGESDEPVRDVQSYSISSDAARLGLIVRRPGSTGFEVQVYQRPSGENLLAMPITAAEVLDAALSPDGQWYAYIASSPGGDLINLLPVADPAGAFQAGVCGSDCAGLLWSPGGSLLIWSDASGVWQIEPALGATRPPVKLAEPYVQIVSGEGNQFAAYRPLSWSPAASFLLLARGNAPDSPRLILVRDTGQIEQLPGPLLYVDPGLSIAWSPDQSLRVLRSRLSQAEPGAFIETWQVQPGGQPLLNLIDSTLVSDDSADAPFGPLVLEAETTLFAMLNFRTPGYAEQDGTYILRSGTLTKLNDLPFLSVEAVLWAPDGSASLILTRHRSLFVPSNGEPIYDLRPFLGANACCFRWVP